MIFWFFFLLLSIGVNEVGYVMVYIISLKVMVMCRELFLIFKFLKILYVCFVIFLRMKLDECVLSINVDVDVVFEFCCVLYFILGVCEVFSWWVFFFYNLCCIDKLVLFISIDLLKKIVIVYIY